MSRIIKATDLHNKTRDVLEWARIDGEEVVVEYFGKPVVVIVRFDKYQNYLRYKEEQREARAERFERLRRLAKQNAALSDLSEEEASALVEEAREEVYQSRHDTTVES